MLRLAHILLNNRGEHIDAFRLGGEEFALLFREYCVQDAYKVCEGIRSIMEASFVPEIKNRQVTFNCGLVCMNKLHRSPASLFQAADAALYQAKNSGKNRIALYDRPSEYIKSEARDGLSMPV